MIQAVIYRRPLIFIELAGTRSKVPCGFWNPHYSEGNFKVSDPDLGRVFLDI